MYIDDDQHPLGMYDNSLAHFASMCFASFAYRPGLWRAVIARNDELVVIRDLYAKAKHHFLVIYRGAPLDLVDLSQTHAALVQRMLDFGVRAALAVLPPPVVAVDGESVRPPPLFQAGFHALPSLSNLHMHIISRDLNSPAMKSLKHWNSFTTPGFVDAEDVIDRLQRNQSAVSPHVDYGAFKTSPLQCTCGVYIDSGGFADLLAHREAAQCGDRRWQLVGAPHGFALEHHRPQSGSDAPLPLLPPR